MCHDTCIEFGKHNLKSKDIFKKSIIEVGSLNYNGSLKKHILKLKPKEYIGVDIKKGVGVDFICDASDLIKYFGKDRFDMVVATELLEHVFDWKNAIHNFKNILKPQGIIFITTRSKGTKYHGFPFDFWRYELVDIKNIFKDFEIIKLEKDMSLLPGVFLKAKKTNSFIEIKLNNYKLFSIIKNKFVIKIGYLDFFQFVLLYRLRMILKIILPKNIKQLIKKVIIINDQI